jgi:hypothetical protein
MGDEFPGNFAVGSGVGNCTVRDAAENTDIWTPGYPRRSFIPGERVEVDWCKFGHAEKLRILYERTV